MTSIKIATFNANNLYVRYNFGKAYPGSMQIEDLDANKGYLPLYQKGTYEMFNDAQRKMAFRALTNDGQSFPDIICLQEIESLVALRVFNETVFKGQYKYCLLIDSYDFRQIDVAILSNLEILNIRTNVDTLDPAWDGKDIFDYQSMHLFSRDCLEVTVLNGATNLTLFINHFKSKMIGTPPKSVKDKDKWIKDKAIKDDAKRLRQTTEVLNILKNRFPGNLFNTEDFVVLGDFNEHPKAIPVQPLYINSNLEDVVARINNPVDRWTHYWDSKSRVSQLDHMLISPSLSIKTNGIIPHIERRAIGYRSISATSGFLPKKVKFETMDDDPNPTSLDFNFPRFDGISNKIDASDHCPVIFEIPQ
jgi:hypothetical protein